MKLDAGLYADQSNHEKECRQLFTRTPLVLAASCELSEPGQCRTMEIAGIPILLVRDNDNVVHAFLNSCTHRGAQLVADGGKAGRFTCPYHGWTFSQSGELVAITLKDGFGDIDFKDYRLVSFPVSERAGLIWGTLDPLSTNNIDDFLQGFDDFLDVFGLDSWRVAEKRILEGTNWKLAFHAHLEFYHVPVLHKNSFGPASSNKALYYFWGPHQRLVQPIDSKRNVDEEHNLYKNADKSEEEWSTESMVLGEWIIFPNVSINLFYDGGAGILISQVVPGASVDESQTIQTFLTADQLEGESRAQVKELSDFLEHVVSNEDLTTSATQQQVLETGLMKTITIGRNEAGIQHFHHWIDRVVSTETNAAAKPFSYEGKWSAP
ncbi:MAG: aromatic ring-hydroxylating dioxygenase subunit alpha [Gammaproteobacteria bacterium]|nr:aromatic ring-hydroxylating dioxygenase subunit alpha [Gammaproteobacteria bacterium]